MRAVLRLNGGCAKIITGSVVSVHSILTATRFYSSRDGPTHSFDQCSLVLHKLSMH